MLSVVTVLTSDRLAGGEQSFHLALEASWLMQGASLATLGGPGACCSNEP